MSLFSAPLVVLDTETTGFPADPQASVVEVGAVLLDTDGSEVFAYGSLVRPSVWHAGAETAAKVHGITRAMVADATEPNQVAEELLAFVGEAWVTAFNVAFDRPMVERLVGAERVRRWRWASCVMLRACDVMGPAGVLEAKRHPHPFDRWFWPALHHAAEFFDVAVEGDAHRALTDARTAARIAVAIRRRELGDRGSA